MIEIKKQKIMMLRMQALESPTFRSQEKYSPAARNLKSIKEFTQRSVGNSMSLI